MALLPATFALEPRLKEQFAIALGEGYSPFIAAIRMFPTDAALASKVAEQWVSDPYVEALRERQAVEVKAKAEVPSKKAQVKRIEARLGVMPADDYLKAERLIAEMLGHLEKAAPPSVVVNNNNQQNTIDRVMVVRDYGTDDEWEHAAAAQQAKLVSEAT